MSHETTDEPKKPSAAKRNNSKMTQLQMLAFTLSLYFVVVLTNNFVAKCVLIKA